MAWEGVIIIITPTQGRQGRQGRRGTPSNIRQKKINTDWIFLIGSLRMLPAKYPPFYSPLQGREGGGREEGG